MVNAIKPTSPKCKSKGLTKTAFPNNIFKILAENIEFEEIKDR